MMFRRLVGLAAVAIAISGGFAFAQTADENRDADALAADMRLLAANPLDIEALVKAGELTLRMGDNTAAAGFFGRAEKLDPLNPRIKAGKAVLMLRAERPGEALRLFQEAEKRGLDPAGFAADRGLAYDLVGEQDRAQRDYRLALRAGPDDETTRRYALSLGISGHKREALDLLDPLLRRSDRAAWRDRAFILAMAGDNDGAQKIANTMMSPGLGAGLAPFFERLPRLPAADRAWAVTFGELMPTPERLADARLVPPLAKLGADPYAPKAVAVAEPPKPVAVADDDGKKRKKRKKDDEALAPAVPAPAPAPKPVELAMNPPAYVPPRVQPLPAPPPPPPAVVVAPKPVPTPAPSPVRVGTPKPAPVTVASDAPPPPAPTPVVTPPPPPAPAVATVEAPPPAPGFTPADAPATDVADRPTAAEAGVTPTATSRVGEDAVLAKIIAGINVPGSELGVAPMPGKTPPPVPRPVEPVAKAPEPTPKPVETPRPVAPTPGKSKTKPPAFPADDVATDTLAKGKKPTAKPAADDTANGKAKTGKAARDEAADARDKGRKAKDDEVALDRNGCPIVAPAAKGKGKGKPAPVPVMRGRGTTAKGKVPARCETDAAKKADAATKGEPARVWVQVAGGANEDTLEKAWAALKVKAPDLFRNRQGWSTPLRNTNRVLTGPFKSADEAQAFVNQLSKAGLSGFVFTSARGQKVDRLGGK